MRTHTDTNITPISGMLPIRATAVAYRYEQATVYYEARVNRALVHTNDDLTFKSAAALDWTREYLNNELTNPPTHANTNLAFKALAKLATVPTTYSYSVPAPAGLPIIFDIESNYWVDRLTEAKAKAIWQKIADLTTQMRTVNSISPIGWYWQPPPEAWHYTNAMQASAEHVAFKAAIDLCIGDSYLATTNGADDAARLAWLNTRLDEWAYAWSFYPTKRKLMFMRPVYTDTLGLISASLWDQIVLAIDNRRMELLIWEDTALTDGIRLALSSAQRIGGKMGSYLNLPGAANALASTPDTAALSIVGDIDLRLKLSLPDWTGLPGDRRLIAKRGASCNFDWFIGASGIIKFFNGTSVFNSTVGVTFLPNEVRWVRFTRNNTTSDGKFYTSTDGTTWTQLGATVTIGVGAMVDTADAVQIGMLDSVNSALTAHVYAAEIRSAIDGTIVADPMFSAQPPGTTSFTDGTGKVWTIAGTASIDLESSARAALNLGVGLSL